MLFKRDDKVWLNGSMAEYGATGLGLGVHGLHYGTGVFEGLRCYASSGGPAVFRLRDHLDRLYASAAAYGLEIRFSRAELEEAVLQTVAANGLTECYVRPICFSGDATMGVHTSPPAEMAVLAWAWDSPKGREIAEKGMRVTVSPWLKISHRMLPVTAKACGQYLNSVLATRDAGRRGFDEALLLNADGTIAEGAVENVFLVKDGKLRTNDAKSSILMGITRASILDLAADSGLDADIGPMRVEDMLSADEAFFTGTALEIAPIRELDGRLIGAGRPGPVTLKLRQAYLDTAAGKNPRRRDWITLVRRGEHVPVA